MSMVVVVEAKGATARPVGVWAFPFLLLEEQFCSFDK